MWNNNDDDNNNNNCFQRVIIKIKCDNVAKSLVQGKFSMNVSYGDSNDVNYNEKFIPRYFGK